MFQIKPVIKRAIGSFHIEKINEKTGEKWSGNEQTNLLTDMFYKALAITENGYQHAEVFETLHVGSGTDTPSPSDIKMKKELWRISVSSGIAKVSSDLQSVSVTDTYVIPASGDYVGTVTEVGLSGEFGLVTHSLLKDAEGNPYSIEKTDLDQLTIVYTITIHLNQINKVLFDPVFRFRFYKSIPDFGTIGYYQSSSNPGGCLTIMKTVMWKGNVIKRYSNSMSIGSDSSSFPYAWRADFRASFAADNADDKTISVSRIRFMKDSRLNGHFLNAILPVAHGSRPGNLQVLLPNPDIMPAASLSDYVVGTGDGETADFIPPIPMWTENTEEIFVDGVKRIRGVDYTCDHFHNLQNNFELIPSAHMIQIEGTLSERDGTEWFNCSGDMGLDGKIRRQAYSLVYDPDDIKENGTMMRVPFIGESVFMMFGEEDLGLDSTVSEVYLAGAGNCRYNRLSLAYSDDAESWMEGLSDITPDEVLVRVRNIAKRLGISHCLSRRPKQLSVGQQQRMILAKALVKDPKIILLDEPMSSNDPLIKEELFRTIKEAQQELNATIVFVTHDYMDAIKYGDILYVIKDSQIVVKGTPKELRDSKEPYLVALKSASVLEEIK